MEIKQTIIKAVDLDKLMKEANIPNLRQLAKMAGVSYKHLNRCKNGYNIMSEKTWKEIAKWLPTYNELK